MECVCISLAVNYRFHRFSDEVRKTISRHCVIHCPSIGCYMSIKETRLCKSLLTSTIHLPPLGTMPAISLQAAEMMTVTTTTEHEPLFLLLDLMSPSNINLLVQVTLVAHVLMGCTLFVIDGLVGDEDDEDGEVYNDNILDGVHLPLLFFFGRDVH